MKDDNAAQGSTVRTPWEFRLRAIVIAFAFGAGFGFGYPLNVLLFGDARSSIVVLGARFGTAGIDTMAWIAAGLTIGAWLVRFWASSYHHAWVVMSPSVITGALTTSGPYRFVRNPLYFGNMLLALGIGLLGPPMATVLVFGLNLAFAYRLILIEEQRLRQDLGATYEAYCARVPRLLPRLSPAHLPRSAEAPNFARGALTEFYLIGFAVATTYEAFVIVRGGGLGIGWTFWLIALIPIVVSTFGPSRSRHAGSQS